MIRLTVEEAHLYYGAAQALRGVSLEAEAGQITCVLGRNGVGKTSLLRGIVGHHPLKKGHVRLGDKNLSGLAPYDHARAGIAYVPQGREIFGLLSVRENLEVGLGAVPRGERFIPEMVFELFPVLKSMLSRRGGDLSGGQQQQLAIGRALVMRPKVIVLDEPTEGIQPSIIQDIGRALVHLKTELGLTILLVEQYLDFAREIADYVCVMDRGEIVHRGPAADLTDDAVQRHLTV